MAEALHEKLLQTVIRQLPAAVIVAEAPSGRIVAANDLVAYIWRRPPILSDNISGYREYHAFHKDGTPYSQEDWPLSRALLTGEVVEREEIRFLRGDGTHGYMRVSASPLHDETGAITAAMVTFIDITDERREQEALELLAEIGAMAGESLHQDHALRHIARMTVPKVADLTIVHIAGDDGETVRTATSIDPQDEARVREVAAPALQEPAFIPRVHDELWNAIADERERRRVRDLKIGSWITVPIRASGRTFGAISFAMTTSGRSFDSFDLLVAEEVGRRAGTAVERSRLFEAEHSQRVIRERTGTRMEHLQRLTAALLPAITVDTVCEAAVREASHVVAGRAIVIGLIRGSSLEVISTIGISKEILERFSSLPMDSPWPIVLAARTGEAVWLRNREEAIELSPIIRDVSTGRAWACLPLMIHGRPIGALGFVFDQEQGFPEEEQTYLASLANQCAIALERALLFERERSARESAEAASRAKDDFLAILSHELRTPMTTVIGWADFLNMTHGGDPAISGPIQALRASAKTQAKLVDDLLDVSRIIARKLSIRTVDTDLAAVVRTAAESVRFTAEKKTLALDVLLADETLIIRGDPDRLQQIVVNLLVNAIKFTASGGRVSVRLTPRAGEIDVIVEDTGEGISPEFLPHVFDRFRQASSGDSRRHTGLGLGLSIVQHLVELHGGRVRAESEGPGKGSRFTVTLPAL